MDSINSHSDNSQLKAARIAGFMFLFTMATSALAEFFVRSKLIVWGNAAETARNISGSVQLFHVGVVSDLICFAFVVTLIVALYAVLKPINGNIALLALTWRLVETAILGLNTLNSYVVLKIFSGAEYLKVIESDNLNAMAHLFINIHGTGYFIGLLFFSLGSTTFNYLFLKSKYIPRILAGWGIFSSLFLFVCTVVILVLPSPPDALYRLSYLPIFIDEVILGFWLLIVGVKTPPLYTNTFKEVTNK